MTKRRTLSFEQIVSTAAHLLDREGLEAFSMRRLAAEIGIDPMAIYHYVPNKAALMQELVRRFIVGFELPVPNGTWQSRIRSFCRAFRRQAHSHPGLFCAYSRSSDWSEEYARLESSLYTTLSDAGFPPLVRARAGRLVLAHIENFVEWELTGWIASYSEEERAGFEANLADARYPEVARIARYIIKVDPDGDFEFGLNVLICGLESELSRLRDRKDGMRQKLE